jgi:DNA repair protein RecN (Recombination protein N)
MLKSLYVRNVALIEEAQLVLSRGLTILTGETGAGKSILIGAFGLILGERASTDLLRQGCDKAIVEGTFDVRGNGYVARRLGEEGYESGDDLIVRREITARGTSRAFVNDSPAPLTLIRDLGDHLVDLHGQHDHQMLLRPDTHIDVLDEAAGLLPERERYAEFYAKVLRLSTELRDLRHRESQLREKQEFYQFQLSEIDAAAPRADEDEGIQHELRILENSEKLLSLLADAENNLSEADGSVYERLRHVRGCLDQLTTIDASFSEYRDECSTAMVVLDELAKHLDHYADRIEFSPERIEEMRSRLALLNALKRKFGGTLDAVLAFRERIAGELDLIGNFDERIAALETDLRSIREEAGRLAVEISTRRKAASGRIQKGVVAMLKQLGIEKARFVVSMSRSDANGSDASVLVDGRAVGATAAGIDGVEFFISMNVGEDPRPLARVASGGEISRVMLALKSILASGGRLPVLVFDEIDTGISGRIASKVGAAIQKLAARHQIIAITHLPQIAAMSQSHFVVEKRELDGRTITHVRELGHEEHTREIAKLMSGETVTESSLRMARELIGE